MKIKLKKNSVIRELPGIHSVTVNQSDDPVEVNVLDEYADFMEVEVLAGDDLANNSKQYVIYQGNVEYKNSKYLSKKIITEDDTPDDIKITEKGKKESVSLKAKAELKMIEKHVNWFKVKMPSGVEGWTNKENISNE